MNSAATSLEHPMRAARSPARTMLIIALAVAGAIVAALMDVPAARFALERRESTLENTDLGRFLRVIGYLPAWLMVAIALLGEWRRRSGSWHGVVHSAGLRLIATTVGAGCLGEVVKLLARRRRPVIDVWYDFRPFGERFLDSGGLSMPSSHSIVAFAGCFALGRSFPGARWPLLVLAVGNGFTRVYAGAHYVSDVYGSALLAWMVTWLISRWMTPSTAA